MSEKHKGQIVERVVRQSGYTITKIAVQLGVSRNTLYNKFENPSLSFEFIRKVGEIISYDFSRDFPDMQREAGEGGEGIGSYTARREFELSGFMREYFALSRQHRSLLEFLVKLANENELVAIKREISRFVEVSDWVALQKDFGDSPSSPVRDGLEP
ncbi:MAG: helix-turn-helix domain-containing protein [Bacteroidota bacterium]